jgi:surface polysaccharide O-acyltransferase-like enzyme
MTQRLYFLDWLRVIAVGAVFLVHAILPFAGGSWIVTDREASTLAALLAGLFNQFGIPLLFLVSGAGVWYALRSRTARQFIGERLKRLAVPFLFGILIFSPVQAYFQLRADEEFAGTLLHHYIPQFFRSNHFTSRDFQWVGSYGYHLWYLFFLLVFSIAALALFLYLRRTPTTITWLASIIRLRGITLLLAVPLIGVQTFLRPRFPDYLGWADFGFWLVFFVYGYVLVSDERFMEAVQRDFRIASGAFIVSLGVIGGIFFMEVGSSITATADYYSDALPLLIAMTLNSWTLILILLMLGKRWLNIPHRFLGELNEAVLPFYLLHHAPIVVIAFFATRWEVSSGVKFMAITFGALFMTLVLYVVVVRPFNILRFLMGMRPRPLSASTEDKIVGTKI